MRIINILFYFKRFPIIILVFKLIKIIDFAYININLLLSLLKCNLRLLYKLKNL